MTTWYIPFFVLAVLGFVIWELRNFRAGNVEMGAVAFNRFDRPMYFWIIVAMHIIVMGTMIFIIGLWAIDHEGIRSAG